LTPALAVAGVVLGVVAVVGWITLFRRFQRFSRPFEELAQAAEKDGVATALQAQLLGVERNAQRIEETWSYAQEIESQLHTAVQGVGFLKYDAFEDIRGSQSYSLCLLDSHKNGVVITSIAGRNDYRGYGKPVQAGVCDLAMSDEERKALELAKQRIDENPLAPVQVVVDAKNVKADKPADKPAEPANV
jgi:hypothetical protein